MVTEGTWVFRSVTNPAFSLDCSPERVGHNQWSPRVTIYCDSKPRSVARTLSAKALAFESPQEAAEAARVFAERWLAQNERQ
jgi:hypothetical protein